MIQVKICGLRTEADLMACRGADMLGFIVGIPESPRTLSLGAAAALMEQADVRTALITTETDPDRLGNMVDRTGPSLLQLHLPLDPLVLEGLLQTLGHRIPIAALVPVLGRDAIDHAQEIAQLADYVLLDSVHGERFGGTGKTHDWSVSRRIAEAVAPTPCVLAGGLTPGNVRAAIQIVRPFGVDVSSGVEESGRKSRQKVEEFLAEARAEGEKP